VDFRADRTTRVGNSDAVAAALERFGRLDAVIRTPAFNTWRQSRSPPRTAGTR
jgi:hypothetical protein